MTTTTQTKACDAYVAAHGACVTYAEDLLHMIQDMPAPESGDGEGFTPNWGHVGNLAHVADLLTQAVEFLRGK